MNRKGFDGKAIYNPSGKAGEYSEWACNFFNGCSNDCDYCYCKRGFMSRNWSDKPTLKKCFRDDADALNVFERELTANLADLRKSSLFFTFTSDPFLTDPAVNAIYLTAMLIALKNGVPIQALTKRHEFAYQPICTNALGMYQDKVAIGFTLTGHDELEAHASTNKQRIDAMCRLHKLGFKTFASIEPVVDFESSLAMIQATVGCCDLYKVGLMSGGGKQYDRLDCISFVDHVHTLLWMDDNNAKIYWKESVSKLVDNNLITNTGYPMAVGADYDIFGRAKV